MSLLLVNGRLHFEKWQVALGMSELLWWKLVGGGQLVYFSLKMTDKFAYLMGND